MKAEYVEKQKEYEAKKARAKALKLRLTCTICGTNPKTLLNCPCGTTQYCSTECQRIDWRDRGHRKACKKIRNERAEEEKRAEAPTPPPSPPKEVFYGPAPRSHADEVRARIAAEHEAARVRREANPEREPLSARFGARCPICMEEWDVNVPVAARQGAVPDGRVRIDIPCKPRGMRGIICIATLLIGSADALAATLAPPATKAIPPKLHASTVREPLLDQYRDFEALREVEFSRESLQRFFRTRPHLVVNRFSSVAWTLRKAQEDWDASGGLKRGEKSPEFDPTTLAGNDVGGRGARLCAALSSLGPVSVKLSQTLSQRPDIVGDEAAVSLKALQTQNVPYDDEIAWAIVREDLGWRGPIAPGVGDGDGAPLFAAITPEPIAPGVYKATTHDGREVAVKVQRPDAMEILSKDYQCFLLALSAVQLSWALSAGAFEADLKLIVDRVAADIYDELDYRKEAENGRDFEASLEFLGFVRTPEVLDEYTTRRVLVTEWVAGHHLSKLPAEEGLKMTRMAVEACTASLVLTGYVHADPHEGNLMLGDDGKLVFLDFGLMSSVDPDIMEAFARGIQACLAEDYAGLAVCFRDVGFLTDPVQYRSDPAKEPFAPAPRAADGSDPLFPEFVDALTDAMETVEGGTSRFGALATVLNQVLAPNWKMFTPPYVLLLVRTFLTLEGIAAEVDPNFNIYEMSLPWAVRRSLAPSSAAGVDALRATLLTPENRVQWRRLLDLVPTEAAEAAAAEKTASTEQAKQEAMNDAVGSPRSPLGAALRQVLNEVDLNDLLARLRSREGRPLRRAASEALGAKVCGLPSDGAPDCPGSPYTEAACGHARCCWKDDRCVAPGQASAGDDLATLQFFGGDQAPGAASARSRRRRGDDDVVAVTSLTFPPIFGAGGGGASGAAFPRNLTFGGAKPALRTIRWRPHELVRSGEVLVDGVTIDVTSTVRVGFNATQVLARLPRLWEFTSFASLRRAGWEWGHPGPPTDAGSYAATLNGSSARSCDARPLRPVLFLEDCDADEPRQRWSGALFDGGNSTLQNAATASCLSNASAQPLMMADGCGAGAGEFALKGGSIVAAETGLCLDAIHGFNYTDIGQYGCHARDSSDFPHQQFRYDGGLLINEATRQCVATSRAPPKRACAGMAAAASDAPCELSAAAGAAKVACAVSLDEHFPSGWVAFVLDAGLEDDAVEADAAAAAADFPKAFDAAGAGSEAWWASLFEPDGASYPGNLPVLETDDAELLRTYYGALLSFGAVSQTTPAGETVYRSVGTTAGATALYMWDTGYSSDVWALLDAPAVADVGALFLGADLDHNNVLDILTRRGAGKYYAFSRYATFLTLRAAVALGGADVAVDALDGLATAYLALPQLDGGMPDYGASPDGFLECVPTYVHGVAALGAANAWMLRETAALHRKEGNGTRAAYLEQLAAAASNATLGLLVEDGGYFEARYPNETVPVRTCLDFIHVGTSIPGDVDAGARKAMRGFFDEELRTPGWMRALSLDDAAAPDSDRADHGPRGAWDGWVGLSATALGSPPRPAHRVYGDNNTEMVRPPRKGGDQAYLATCGVTLASAVIRTLFGFDPPVQGAADPAALLRDARTPRGFDGVLRRVPYRGALYDIKSRKDRGLEIAPSSA
ncbi:hypothetical protein JL721_1663 [Aureococcus anophagefferens]|nr:hypothetical protein JL721_1663 [Aureococcus anophagefferens]